MLVIYIEKKRKAQGSRIVKFGLGKAKGYGYS